MARAEVGQKLFMRDGCYQCHGTRGQGGGVAGPRLAPDPLPLDIMLRILRKPLDRMPVYTARVLADEEAAAIYTYLLSIPAPKPVQDISILR
jgi:mono/diheme cytochrome c family protein